MTREEAINFLNEKRAEFQVWVDIAADPMRTYPDICAFCEAIDLALAALRAHQEAEKNERRTTKGLLRSSATSTTIQSF